MKGNSRKEKWKIKINNLLILYTFHNYFVPIFQGSPEVVYPRVNNFSILILILSYLFVILSLISGSCIRFILFSY